MLKVNYFGPSPKEVSLLATNNTKARTQRLKMGREYPVRSAGSCLPPLSRAGLALFLLERKLGTIEVQ
jgi:hypothetical protein